VSLHGECSSVRTTFGMMHEGWCREDPLPLAARRLSFSGVEASRSSPGMTKGKCWFTGSLHRCARPAVVRGSL
jgi:hypothetical protein